MKTNSDFLQFVALNRIKEDSSEHSSEESSELFVVSVGTHEKSILNSALKYDKDAVIDNQDRTTATTTAATTAAATTTAITTTAAAAAAATTSISISNENQNIAKNLLTNIADLTLTIHTTHTMNIVKILTFEINVPQEGSQWSRYRKNVARNKIKNNYKNSNYNTNKANQIKSELFNSEECVQTNERTWGISTVNFIATVDLNGKIFNDFYFDKYLLFHDYVQIFCSIIFFRKLFTHYMISCMKFF